MSTMPILLFSLLLLIVWSLLLWLLRPHRHPYWGWFAALPPAAITLWLISRVISAPEQVLSEQWDWAPTLGLTLSLRLDGLGLLFGLIIAGIGTAIVIYASYYFEQDARLGYFYSLLFLFMASMLGVVWADNLLALFVFWEGTSITSYLLIGFKTEDEDAQAGARQAFLVTGAGAMALLAGMVLLGQMAGTYTISEILATPNLSAQPLFPAALVLILLGAFTKSAQFPFHFWLPNAMAAPTPASAYLHSATMVKAGIYLLARLHGGLSDSPLWFWSLLIIGGITMLLGAISALRYYDLKAILAYATISQLGILVMLLAFPTQSAFVAVVVGIFAHALYKGPLFMVAGIIDHATGARDIRRLADLGRAMPWVALAALLAGLSMAGLIPLFGFVAKETLLEVFYEYRTTGNPLIAWLGIGAATLAGAFFVAYSVTLLWEPFLRRRAAREIAPVHHAPAFGFVLPVLALAGISTAMPFLLGVIEGPLLSPAASAIARAPVAVHLLLWHGFTPVFITSLVAIGLGLLIFWRRQNLRTLLAMPPAWLNGADLFDRTVDGVYALARRITYLIQERSLATQAIIPLLGAVVALLYAMLQFNPLRNLPIQWTDIPRFEEIVIAGLAIVAAVVTVRARTRLGAIISFGVVGVMVTLVFVLFGAPDLALTQLLVEVLSVVLLILVFYRIPATTEPPISRPLKIRNLLVAGATGILGFVMALIGIAEPYAARISDFYLLNSVAEAHGANVVNVILVDFRSLDTLGEISVLAIAALGGFALLRAHRLRPLPDQVDTSVIQPPSNPETPLRPDGRATKVEAANVVEG